MPILAPFAQRESGEGVAFERLQDCTNRKGNSYVSIKAQHQYDCTGDRERILALTKFSGNIGSGKVVYKDSSEGKWRPVAPGNVSHDLGETCLQQTVIAQTTLHGSMGQWVAKGDDALTMRGVEHDGHEELTLLELVLQLHGKFRTSVAPIRVTSLQAGVMLYLHWRADAKLTDAAASLRLRLPSLSVAVKALVRKRWVIKRYSVTDSRAVCLSLSRRGGALARRIEEQVRGVSTGVATNKDVTTAGLTRLHRVPTQPKEASS